MPNDEHEAGTPSDAPSRRASDPGGPVPDPGDRRQARSNPTARFAFAGAVIVVGTVVFAVLASLTLAHATSNPLPKPSDTPSIELRYFARVALGVEHLAGDARALRNAGGLGQIRSEVESFGGNPLTAARGAIVLAEIDEDAAALEMLDHARSQLDRYAALIEGDPAAERPEALTEQQADALRAEPDLYATRISNLREDIAAIGEVIRRDTADFLDDEGRQRLADRHGFLGELLLAHRKPDDHPLRKPLIDSSARMMLILVPMIVVALLAILAGLVLFVLAAVLLGTGRITPRLNWKPRMHPAKRAALLETVAVFFVGFAALQLLAPALAAWQGVDATPVLIWLLAPIALWPLARGMTRRELVVALGWHANGRGVLGLCKEAVLGVVGYVAGLPIFIAGVLIAFGLIALSGSEPSHPVVQRAGDTSPLGIATLYLLTTVWAPLVEESIFRGAMYVGLRRRFAVLGATLINAVVFALIHPQGWALAPALASVAVVFSLLREWRGSLIPSITAHAVHNAFFTTLLIVILG